jgi:thiamine pyrophosphate-dependent acetolactate synthase large subunit-like protein
LRSYLCRYADFWAHREEKHAPTDFFGKLISALLEYKPNPSHRTFAPRNLEHYRKARKGLDELAAEEHGMKPIHPQYVARVLDELAARDAIFTCDVGTPTIWGHVT